VADIEVFSKYPSIAGLLKAVHESVSATEVLAIETGEGTTCGICEKVNE